MQGVARGDGRAVCPSGGRRVSCLRACPSHFHSIVIPIPGRVEPFSLPPAASQSLPVGFSRPPAPPPRSEKPLPLAAGFTPARRPPARSPACLDALLVQFPSPSPAHPGQARWRRRPPTSPRRRPFRVRPGLGETFAGARGEMDLIRESRSARLLASSLTRRCAAQISVRKQGNAVSAPGSTTSGAPGSASPARREAGDVPSHP